jgi:hypothetical protein
LSSRGRSPAHAHPSEIVTSKVESRTGAA